MQGQKRYIIYNTTRKPAPDGGPDTRTVRDKVGHNISVSNDDGISVVVTPGNFAITSRVTEGTMKLKQHGKAEIRECGDITEVLKQHAIGPATPAPRRPSAGPEKKPVAIDEKPPKTTRARAVEMGKDAHVREPVNPTGKPNFEVATKEVLSRGRRRGPAAKEARSG